MVEGVEIDDVAGVVRVPATGALAAPAGRTGRSLPGAVRSRVRSLLQKVGVAR